VALFNHPMEVVINGFQTFKGNFFSFPFKIGGFLKVWGTLGFKELGNSDSKNGLAKKGGLLHLLTAPNLSFCVSGEKDSGGNPQKGGASLKGFSPTNSCLNFPQFCPQEFFSEIFLGGPPKGENGPGRGVFKTESGERNGGLPKLVSGPTNLPFLHLEERSFY